MMRKKTPLHIKISYWDEGCHSFNTFGFEMLSDFKDEFKIMDKIKKALKKKQKKCLKP